MNIKELLQVIKTMDVDVKENTISKTTGLDIIEITGKNYFNIDIEGKVVKVSYIIKTGEIINHWIDDNGNVIHLCLPIIFNGELKLPSIENAKQIANDINNKIMLSKVERDEDDNSIQKAIEKVTNSKEVNMPIKSFGEDFDKRHKIINATTYGAIDGRDIETGRSVNDVISEMGDKIISDLTSETDKEIMKFIEDNNDVKEDNSNIQITSTPADVSEAAKFKLVDKIAAQDGEIGLYIETYDKIKKDCVTIGDKSYEINRDFPNVDLDEDDETTYGLIEASDINEVETINNNEGDVEIMCNPFIEYEERERSIVEKRESLEKLFDENEPTKILECKVGDKVTELEEGINCHLIDFDIFNAVFVINIGLTPIDTHIRANMNSFLDVEIELLYEEVGEIVDDNLVPVKDIGTFRMSVRNILEEGLGAWYSFDDGEFRLSPLELRGLTTLFRM